MTILSVPPPFVLFSMTQEHKSIVTFKRSTLTRCCSAAEEHCRTGIRQFACETQNGLMRRVDEGRSESALLVEKEALSRGQISGRSDAAVVPGWFLAPLCLLVPLKF